MDKLRSGASRFTSAFKRDDGLRGVLQKRERSERSRGTDPFIDGPVMEEPSLPSSHMWIHFATLFFNFLAICTLGATAGFQAKWMGVSGGTGFSLFVLLTTFLLTSFLVIVPLVYDKWDRFKRPAQFLGQARVVLILHAFGSVLILISAMIVTVSAFGSKGCKNPDDDPHASLGDAFKEELGQWCTTKKACGVFIWLATGGWLILTVLAVILFRRERRREPAFIPPSSPGAGIGYSHVPGREHEHEREHEHGGADRYDEYAEKATSHVSGARHGLGLGMGMDVGGDDERDVGTYNRSAHSGYEGRMEPAPATSVGGAFPLRAQGQGQEGEPSRTMRMAYTDPYAQVRQSLMQGTYAHPNGSTPPPAPVPVPAPTPAPVPVPTPAPQQQHGYHSGQVQQLYAQHGHGHGQGHEYAPGGYEGGQQQYYAEGVAAPPAYGGYR